MFKIKSMALNAIGRVLILALLSLWLPLLLLQGLSDLAMRVLDAFQAFLERLMALIERPYSSWLHWREKVRQQDNR